MSCTLLLLWMGLLWPWCPLTAQGNPEADSLLLALESHPERDSVRVKTLLALAAALERENPGQSVTYALDAQEIAQALELPLLQADAFQQAGNSYGVLGANMKQRECYVVARKIFQDQGNFRGEVAVLNNLAAASLDENNFEFAREYLNKALRMTLSSTDHRNLAAIYNNLGNMWDGMLLHDSALTYYNRAYDEVRQQDNAIAASIILGNIGNTHAELGDLKKAIGIYHECRAIKQDIGDLFGLSELYMNLAESHREAENTDSALYYFQLGLGLADSLDAVEMQELLHRQMARLYEKLGKTGLSLEHYAASVLLLDSLRKDEAISATEATQMRIQAEQTIHARELATAKAEIVQQDQLRQQRTVILASIVVLGLILLLLFVIFRRYRERRRAATLLEAKVQERTVALSEANEKLQQALKELEVSNRDLNTFIYRSSHDLRSPLTSIGGLLDIIQRALGEHEARQYVKLAEDKASHLNRLLVQLIESVDLLAREPKGSVVGLRELWEDLMAGLAGKPGFEAVRFELDAPDGLQVVTDRDCLRVMLNSLLANAIDFRKQGLLEKPWCKVTVRTDTRGCTFRVEDNGIGMGPDVQARAFEMFYRGSLQAQGIGNGMGLYTARKTLELIGGEIAVESVEGKGSVFTVRTPALC